MLSSLLPSYMYYNLLILSSFFNNCKISSKYISTLTRHSVHSSVWLVSLHHSYSSHILDHNLSTQMAASLHRSLKKSARLWSWFDIVANYNFTWSWINNILTIYISFILVPLARADGESNYSIQDSRSCNTKVEK